jgi:hypothetical protein
MRRPQAPQRTGAGNPTLTRRGLVAGALVALAAPSALAGSHRIEGFAMRPDAGWRFFTDGVMGGVSTGRLEFRQEGGTPHARMTGRVSTANRGGFIQMRLDLDQPPPADSAGVRLVVRGNGQRYFVHLRTTGTVLPWQFYQAGFDAPPGWAEVQLPFAAFRPSGALLRAVPRPESLTSIALAAYGRDHDAEVDLRDIGFF